MKTIKIIDLLNMISKGEEVPKKIKWGVHELDLSVYDYKAKDEFGNPSFTDLLENVFNRHALNDEVEILEEEKKIPEKLYHCAMDTDNKEIRFLIKNINGLADKINEILDYLETKGE